MGQSIGHRCWQVRRRGIVIMNSSKSMGAVSPVASFRAIDWVVAVVALATCILMLSGCVNSSAHVDAPRELMRAQLEKSVRELMQEMLASPQFSEIYEKVKSAKRGRPVIGVEICRTPNESIYVRLMHVMRHELLRSSLWDFSSRFETVQAEYANYRFRRYHPYPYDRIRQLDHELDELRRKELDFLLTVKLANSTDVGDSSSFVLFMNLIYDSKTGEGVFVGQTNVKL